MSETLVLLNKTEFKTSSELEDSTEEYGDPVYSITSGGSFTTINGASKKGVDWSNCIRSVDTFKGYSSALFVGLCVVDGGSTYLIETIEPHKSQKGCYVLKGKDVTLLSPYETVFVNKTKTCVANHNLQSHIAEQTQGCGCVVM